MLHIGKTHRGADIDRLDSRTQLLFLLMRYGVRHNQLLQLTLIQLLTSVSTENSVSDDRDTLPGTVLNDHIGSFYQGAARIRHVIDNDGDAVAHVTDQYHAADFVGSGPLFMDESEAKIEAVGYGCCPSSPNEHTATRGYLH